MRIMTEQEFEKLESTLETAFGMIERLAEDYKDHGVSLFGTLAVTYLKNPGADKQGNVYIKQINVNALGEQN